MPISASAKKSLRVALRRTAENRTMKSRVKNQLKKTTVENVSSMVSLLDKAAKNHVIHKNKASRLKSRLMKRLNNPVESVAAPTKAAKKPAAKKATAKKTK